MPKNEVELKPFQVPNYVIQKTPPRTREEGFRESPKFALSELTEDTLAELCDEFRRGVFQKAAKPDPAA